MEIRNNVCSSCPLRTDRPRWMSWGNAYQNYLWLKEGFNQGCHKTIVGDDPEPTLKCRGAAAILGKVSKDGLPPLFADAEDLYSRLSDYGETNLDAYLEAEQCP